MRLILVIFAMRWTSGHSDLLYNGEENHGCTESSWLCKELAMTRQAMSEQKLIDEKQNSMIAHLSSEISQQVKLIDEQKATITELQHMVWKLETDIKRIRNLNTMNIQDNHDDRFASMQQANQAETTQTTISLDDLSDVHKIVNRADDFGSLETVVNQIGQQVTAISADVQALKNSESQQNQNIQDARTSTFVHWGSSQCPSDSQLVYSGLVGGSHYTQSGGGTNYLCLTMSPVFSAHSLPDENANMYGAEYETRNDQHQNLDALCAVCRARHATTIMIPGTNVCTQGWTKQYDGYLMAEHFSYKASQFICVDSVMESRPGTNANLDGALLYFTVTQCGSLPCGPYQNNKIMTCVVCSQ